MAEVLGAISAIAVISQLLEQIGSVLIKAKQFRDQVKNAPQAIHNLLREIQNRRLILSWIEKSLNTTALPPDLWDHDSARKILAETFEAFDELYSVVAQLHSEIVSTEKRRLAHKITATKVVFKNGTLEKLQNRLEKALSTTDMLMQVYMIAYQTRPLHITEAKSDVVPIEEPPMQDDGAGEVLGESELTPEQNRNGRSRQVSLEPTFFGWLSVELVGNGAGILARARPPSWCMDALWEFSLPSPRVLSRFTFRCYNLRNDESEIFKCVKDGKLTEMMNMFNNGLASPFDRDQAGWTLLHIATWECRPEICQKLLQLGLESCVDEEVDCTWTPREMTVFLNTKLMTPYPPLAVERKIKIMELFQSAASETHSDADESVFLLKHGADAADKKLIMEYQRRFAPSYYRVPFRERLLAVRIYAQTSKLFDGPPEGMMMLLHKDTSICLDDILMADDEELSLIHTLAIAIGYRASAARHCPEEQRSSLNWHGWGKLLAEAINSCASDANCLHRVEAVVTEEDPCVWTGTPLLSLIQSACLPILLASTDEESPKWRNSLDFGLQFWLKTLQSCGVDLVQ